MKKFLYSTLAAALISGAVYSQKPDTSKLINLAVDYLTTIEEDPITNPYIRNKKGLHPLALRPENINNIFSFGTYGLMSNKNMLKEFHKSFLDSVVLDNLPELIRTDSLSTLYWQAKNSNGLNFMVYTCPDTQIINENTILIDISSKQNPRNKLTYVFHHTDNFELTSFELRVNYLPKTVWPKINLFVDEDGDGLNDNLEMYFFNTLRSSANDDWDGDGISNIDEINAKSNPEKNPRFTSLNFAAKVQFYDGEPTLQIDNDMIKDTDAFLNQSFKLFCAAAGYYNKRTKKKLALENMIKTP